MISGISETRLMAGGGLETVESRMRQIEGMISAIEARQAVVAPPANNMPLNPLQETGKAPKPFQFYLQQAAGSDKAEAPLSAKAAAFQPLIAQASAKYGLDPTLLNAVIRQESGFNPNAVSKAGAAGLMQLMPGTARDLGVSNVHDPAQNVDGGARYLRQILDQFNGNIPLALAAYNAGPGAVTRHKGIPPYKETQNYVRTILANFLQAKQQGGEA